MNYPILYSFRRCPYAMRARLAIVQAQQTVELREVVLRDKPPSMLEISPKGTVPVLQLPDETIIDESYDVMIWALTQNDPDNWLRSVEHPTHTALLEENDGSFKKNLDKYKYANRHPKLTEEQHRANGEVFLQKLEDLLKQNSFLIDQAPSITDAAIFPFIRQFTRVDQEWFESADYPNLKKWLDFYYKSSLLEQAMKKYPQWHKDDEKTLFPPENIDKNA
jgi:glutathione S-transferase